MILPRECLELFQINLRKFRKWPEIQERTPIYKDTCVYKDTLKIFRHKCTNLSPMKDYVCPEVWLEYIQYAIRWLSQENGIAQFRSLCEKAIQAGFIIKRLYINRPNYMIHIIIFMTSQAALYKAHNPLFWCATDLL